MARGKYVGMMCLATANDTIPFPPKQKNDNRRINNFRKTE